MNLFWAIVATSLFVSSQIAKMWSRISPSPGLNTFQIGNQSVMTILRADWAYTFAVLGDNCQAIDLVLDEAWGSVARLGRELLSSSSLSFFLSCSSTKIVLLISLEDHALPFTEVFVDRCSIGPLFENSIWLYGTTRLYGNRRLRRMDCS